MDLATVIGNYRRQHSLSLRGFAAKCGLSHTYVDNLEKNLEPHTGKPARPSIDVLRALAKGMDLTLEELMTRAGLLEQTEGLIRINGTSESRLMEAHQDIPAADLPDWIKHLSPEMQDFIRDEAATGWPYIKAIWEARLAELSPEDIQKVLSTMVDFKRRVKQEEDRKV